MILVITDNDDFWQKQKTLYMIANCSPIHKNDKNTLEFKDGTVLRRTKKETIEMDVCGLTVDVVITSNVELIDKIGYLAYAKS